jgi:Txe/YoeB family toxin of Txe-Axe toxin-antitoxin module
LLTKRATVPPATLARLNALIEDARRHPFTGLGKPEVSKGAHRVV